MSVSEVVTGVVVDHVTQECFMLVLHKMAMPVTEKIVEAVFSDGELEDVGSLIASGLKEVLDEVSKMVA